MTLLRIIILLYLFVGACPLSQSPPPFIPPPLAGEGRVGVAGHALAMLAPAFGLPKPGCQPVGKGAANLLARRNEPAAPVAKPNTRGFTDADSQCESRGGIESSSCNRADDRHKLERFAQPVPQRPPCKRASSDGTAELGKGRGRPRHAIAACQRAQRNCEHSR